MNILAIFSNHTSNLTKYYLSINNIDILKKYISKFYIIDTNDVKYNNKVIDYYRNDEKFIGSFLIPNDNYYDFGKWIHVLNNISYDSFDYILFVNDSIIINNDIEKYFNFMEYKLNKDTKIYAYNDSSQIEYHYQSYFFSLHKSIIPNLIKLFDEKKKDINDMLSLIMNMEMNLINLDKNHDSYIKIANTINISKNIFWHNDFLYDSFLRCHTFAILKLKKIYEFQQEYCLNNMLNDTFDPSFYREYYDLHNYTNDKELYEHFQTIGFKEGKKPNKIFKSVLPISYRTFFKNLNILCFFDIPEDFDIYYYKFYNSDIQHLTLFETISHYINIGIYENRIYNKEKTILYHFDLILPNDFNLSIYKKINSDLKNLSDNELIEHYFNYGKYENRIYKLPDDFNPLLYKELNLDLINMNENQLIEHFIHYGINEKRIYKKEKYENNQEHNENKLYLPKDFYPEIYKELNFDLSDKNNEQLEKHYILYGYKENRYYNIPRDFTLDGYRKFNEDLKNLNDEDLIIHFFLKGMTEKRLYKIPDDFEPELYKLINKDLENIPKNKLLKHYLKIGIKEKRFYKLNLYFKPSIYRELNEDLKYLNDLECKIHFIQYGIKERRKFS